MLIVLGGLGIYYALKFRVGANEFAGMLQQGFDINSGTLVVKGAFKSEKNPEISKIRYIVNIIIDKDTKITRVEVVLPTPEELKKTNGFYDGSKLERRFSQGSLEILAQDLGGRARPVNIFVTAKGNIYGKDSFVASEIKYEISSR